MKLYGYTFIAIALTFFSVHAVIIRYLISDYGMSPLLITFLRFFIGGVFLALIFLMIRRQKIKDDIASIKDLFKDKILWLSTIFLFFNFLTFHLGLKYTFASNSILIETLSPVVVLLISLAFFKSKFKFLQSHTRKLFFSILIATIGSSLLIMNSGETLLSQKTKIWGDILEFVAMILFALFIIFNSLLRKKYLNLNGVLITSLGLLIGAFFSFFIAFGELNSMSNFSSDQWLLILLLGVGSTGIGYFAWFMASKYLNHITLALLFNIVGVTTILVEYFVYKDSGLLDRKIFVGGALILGVSMYIEHLNSQSKQES